MNLQREIIGSGYKNLKITAILGGYTFSNAE
jgi:hypothetical protein